LLALLLAATGIYGVVSYTAEQRRKEIGIRLALGARPREVVRLILSCNSRAAGIGLLAGLAIATASSRLIESQLYGVSRFDPAAYGAALALLLLAGFAASVAPIRRAARADAMTALHHD
jgi:ABC-type antimicrobial peptide transport system permease subunit